MQKALDARNRLRARIEMVLSHKGGFEVDPYLEAIAIEQWLYGDPTFLASLVEENTLSTDAAAFVAEILRGGVAQAERKAAARIHPGAALFAVAWHIAHRDVRRAIAVERVATDMNVTAGTIWLALEEFDEGELSRALDAVRTATDEDVAGVVRNKTRPPVFGGTIWTSKRVGLGP